MIQQKPTCACCEAQFGLKFDAYTCSKCKGAYCRAHIIQRGHITLGETVELAFGPKEGLCYQCLFQLWGKTDEAMKPALGIFGRFWTDAGKVTDSVLHAIGLVKPKTELIKISPEAFESIVTDRAWAVFFHQKEIPLEFMVKDLMNFARALSVTEGRHNERDLCLKDLYRMADWLRTHPKLPSWLHGFSWADIETSSVGFNYVMDAWHLTGSALALSNPASGVPWVAYHLGDRIVEQKTGDGLFMAAFNKFSDRLGLNVNPKKALVVFLAGLFLLKLYRESESKATD